MNTKKLFISMKIGTIFILRYFDNNDYVCIKTLNNCCVELTSGYLHDLKTIETTIIKTIPFTQRLNLKQLINKVSLFEYLE